MTTVAPHRTRAPERGLAIALAAWAFAYACYRAYYAFGGDVGMIGVPVSDAQLRALNGVGAVIILLAAAVPLVVLKVPALWRALPVVGWIAAVGCCMHALVDGTLRVLSITGVHPTSLPASVWLSVDVQAADWQDLLFNEPWFLIEGLLWGAFALAVVSVARRRVWLLSAVAAVLVLTAFGVLTGLDVIGSFHLG